MGREPENYWEEGEELLARSLQRGTEKSCEEVPVRAARAPRKRADTEGGLRTAGSGLHAHTPVPCGAAAPLPHPHLQLLA